MKVPIVFIAILVAIAGFSLSVSSQARSRVRFATRTNETILHGTASGYAYRDYVFVARAGQSIKITVTGSTPSTVFTLMDSTENVVDGSAEIDTYDGVLPKSGDYIVRVMMMRSQARRKGSVSKFTLTVSIK